MATVGRRSSTKHLDKPNNNILERLLPWVLFIFIIGLWEWLAYTDRVRVMFFPAPSKIFTTFVELINNGELQTSLFSTLSRLIVGFSIGGLSGFFIGMMMGWKPILRKMIDPIIAAIHPLPKISILPLIMVFFGIGETSRIIVIAITAFFPILINTMAGVSQIPKIYFDVAHNYGISPFRVFTRVVLPGSLPNVLAGMRIAGNVALTIAIVVEIITANEGLGRMIWISWEIFKMPQLYAVLMVIVFLGFGINYLFDMLHQILIPWHNEN